MLASSGRLKVIASVEAETSPATKKDRSSRAASRSLLPWRLRQQAEDVDELLRVNRLKVIASVEAETVSPMVLR